MRIAVISDLHCDHDAKCADTYLTVGAPRGLFRRHPTQALIELIRGPNDLKADLLVCPGDLANKFSTQGFAHSWDALREIQRELNASEVLVTIGNHDVGSRVGGNPFEVAKTLHPDFPFRDAEDKNRYWTQGFAVRHSAGASIAIINSAHDHYTERAAQHGTFAPRAIDELRDYLNTLVLKDIRVAVLHHHPVLHSVADFDSADVLPTGDLLLECLAEFDFNIVIHGHRHFPKVSRADVLGRSIHIIAAGSFSANLMALGTLTRNMFHILDFETSRSTYQDATLFSWEFNWGVGWNPSTTMSARFPHKIAIGHRHPATLLLAVKERYGSTPRLLVREEIFAEYPEIAGLLPDELEALSKDLLSANVKLGIDAYGDIHELGSTST